MLLSSCLTGNSPKGQNQKRPRVPMLSSRIKKQDDLLDDGVAMTTPRTYITHFGLQALAPDVEIRR